MIETIERIESMNSIERSIHTGDDSINVGCSRSGASTGAAYGSSIGKRFAGSIGATIGYVIGAIIGAVFGPDDSFKVNETTHLDERQELKQLL